MKKISIPFLILIAILILSTVLHFYLFPSHIHFEGDEAAMSQTIKDIVVLNQYPSMGPSASLGNGIYHGAFFYYLYVIPAVLFHFTAWGYALFTSLLSIASVVLLYYALKDFADQNLALMATALYALSANVIYYGRWEWNPNTIPFFCTLALFSLAQFLNGKAYYLIPFAFSLGAITQLHLTGFVMIPVAICMIPLLMRKTKNILIWAASIIAFLLPALPTIIHEIHHNYPMLRALVKIFLHPAHTSLLVHATKGYSTMLFLFFEIVQVQQVFLGVVLIISTGALLYLVWKYFKTNKGVFLYFILLILFFSFLMYAFYPSIVFIHYAEQLFPIFPIITALFINMLMIKKQLLILALFVLLYIFNLNWQVYSVNLIHGKADFATQVRICEDIQKAGGNKKASVVVNGVFNPGATKYICQNDVGITLSNSPKAKKYTVTTDYISQYRIE